MDKGFTKQNFFEIISPAQSGNRMTMPTRRSALRKPTYYGDVGANLRVRPSLMALRHAGADTQPLQNVFL